MVDEEKKEIPRKRIFSVTYIALFQKRFEDAISEGNLGAARTALGDIEKMPGKTSVEQVDRLIVLVEGYKTLTEGYEALGIFGNERKDRLLERMLELKKYRHSTGQNGNGSATLEEDIHQLRRYRAVGDIDELEALRDRLSGI